MTNPFRSPLAAQRYAAGRPDVHAEFARRIELEIGPRQRVLDVGCGTGLSTRALSTLATRAVGLDAAQPMLTEAARNSGGAFVLGSAEALPFRANEFDLVALGCVSHWCDATVLLREVHRVLAPDAHLAVFDHWFAGRLGDEPRFAAWHDDYVSRFAPPNRHASFDTSSADGFQPLFTERFDHLLTFSRDELVAYLTSQSNVLWAVETKAIQMDQAESELRAGLAPFFGSRKSARLRFIGKLDLLSKR